MKVSRATSNHNIYARWAFKEDKKPNRTLWITEGDNKNDFYGSTIAIDEKEVPKLVAALQKLLDK